MHSAPFKKILIANRGEIAIRIARAATELSIPTVGIYAYEDRNSLHRYKTDESYRIGSNGEPLQAYLDFHQIIELAKSTGATAIHPGYGLLSENAQFASACEKNGIVFIGPDVSVLEAFGNKVSARKIAQQAGLIVVPGTDDPVDSLEEAQSIAEKIGYPVTLKAVSGGGGKGIRMIHSPQMLQEAFERAQSEAKSSFGESAVYLEKTIVNPRHIEVQILADSHETCVHLFTRDCSIQRRHQKVVEVAPACSLEAQTTEALHEQAIRIAKHVNYRGLGTVEFLVDESGKTYFLEVNPRIQVEHTVTEMITGFDLVQASILVATGRSLADPMIGIGDQSDIPQNGIAIQCRITTEDPLNDFVPDTGKIFAYRPAAGFGIRLDEGLGTSGGVVTPYYDSLLVKVTAWGKSLEQAASKMHRCLSEFRIRGVKHNIPLLKNIVSNGNFLNAKISTNFLTKERSVFDYVIPRDRATKLLRYIAEVTVNDPHGLKSKVRSPARQPAPPDPYSCAVSNRTNAKGVLDREGPDGLIRWIKNHQRLLLTDTTMRDAHQSLFATRLRTKDILSSTPYYASCGHDFFSLEVWGGATFDTAMRFLKEDPWLRLRQIRESVPNILLQMLLRGDNAVGYTNYPAWVVREFIAETVRCGLDVFRIFDCLNQPDKMQIAIEEVKKNQAVAEVCVCYTGDLSSPNEEKYTLAYYQNLSRELVAMGADILCIKDMAGLLKPKASITLINALKDTVDIPIHLHTHDTSGAQVATLLAAAEAGCDIVDGAISSMSGLTSQPSLNAVIGSLQGEPICPDVPMEAVDHLGHYWQGVRSLYDVFDPGIKSTSTDVYIHEIPGGQYSNLYNQAVNVGLSSEEFQELTKRYREVNDLLGNIIKVTPSSKVVGDLALLLHKNDLTGPRLLSERPKLDYPDSVVSFLKGHMGVPYGGFPQEVRELVLGKNPPAPYPPQTSEDDSLSQVQTELEKMVGRPCTTADVLSFRLYPKVYLEFVRHERDFGSVTTSLPTEIFFHGLKQDHELEVHLEQGKTLYITLKGVSETGPDGYKTVFFNLNGFDREVTIVDLSSQAAEQKHPKADPTDPRQIAAPMPGKVIDIKVKVGDSVREGDPLLVTESMKMEYIVSAKQDGTVGKLHATLGTMIQQDDLLAELQ